MGAVHVALVSPVLSRGSTFMVWTYFVPSLDVMPRPSVNTEIVVLIWRVLPSGTARCQFCVCQTVYHLDCMRVRTKHMQFGAHCSREPTTHGFVTCTEAARNRRTQKTDCQCTYWLNLQGLRYLFSCVCRPYSAFTAGCEFS